MNLKNNPKGFTLTEVLIVLGASAIIGTVLVTLMVQGSSAIFNQNVQINHNIALNNASSKLNETIKYASSIQAVYTNGLTQYSSNSTSIIVNLPSINQQGSVIDNKHDVIVIAKDPLKPAILRKYIFADPVSSRKSTSQVILTNLSFIQFVYLGDNETGVSPTAASRVDYTIKTAEKTAFSSKESSISGRINLKNL